MLDGAPLRKMASHTDGRVHYSLILNGDRVELDRFIGREFTMKATGALSCVVCGRPVRKLFGQGYCFPCLQSAPEAAECILRPELCRAHLGEGRDPAWEREHHHTEHTVYLSYTGGIKVGVSSSIEYLRTDAYSGDLSAIIIRNLPIWVEVRRTPVIETALLDNWEVKIEKMARETMREDVRCIAGVPSWTLVLLKRILEITGKQNILEVWPNLELFMHGGVSFRPYKAQFEAIIPSPTMNYLESYNASEGHFAVQDRCGAEDMLLMLDYGIFYEFLPLDQLDQEHPRTVLLHEVEQGATYAMVISTNGGLWRYMPGDTVRFTDVKPYRIQVSGRTKSFINAFGEELVVDNADRGMQEACADTGALVNDYTAGPIYMDDKAKGGHEWVVEFGTPPSDMARFVQVLDDTMRSLNSDYDAKRRGDMALRMPVVHSVPTGTFHAWMKQRGKLGGQNKVPRLSNDRTILTSILTPQPA